MKKTNIKIIKSNEFQSKLFKEFLSFKNSQKNNHKNESEEKNTDLIKIFSVIKELEVKQK